MTIMIIGMILFFSIHFAPSTALKPVLVNRLGTNGYKGVFTVISIIGLGLMIYGFGLARGHGSPSVYTPPQWGRHVTMTLVLLAFMALMASFHKGRITKFLRQPMSISIALWAVGHLAANGQLNDVLLFGSLLLYSLYDIIHSTYKKPARQFVVKPIHDLIIIAGGLLLYAVVLFAHPWITGVSVLP